MMCRGEGDDVWRSYPKLSTVDDVDWQLAVWQWRRWRRVAQVVAATSEEDSK
jgi:hypothetical protein